LTGAEQEKRTVDIQHPVDLAVGVFEVAGVVVLLAGAVLALVLAAAILLRRLPASDAYRVVRESMGKAILLSLELLVAADIIRSVVLEPTFASIGVLGLLVLIRTFLSWSLEVEIEGMWPWQRTRDR
jgi:uncharacterized membrane protein